MWEGDWICEAGGVVVYIQLLKSTGAGYIVHLLRMRTALPEDPSLVPTPVQGDSQPSEMPAKEGSSASGFSEQLCSHGQTDVLTSVHTRS